ncbi:MAG: hypothetical protein ACE5HB_04310 [Terriglobia bacterium]
MLSLVIIFALGALLVGMAAGLLREAFTALVERYGRRLDRWRRNWFQPEREAASFLRALLVTAFAFSFGAVFDQPAWLAWSVAVVWGLRLPTDLWTGVRLRRRPHDTLRLHKRGFWLLHAGPLWVRALTLATALGCYVVLTPVQRGLSGMMAPILTWLAELIL